MISEQNKVNFYQSQAQMVSDRITKLKAQSRRLMVGNIASFMAALGCIILLTLTDTAWKQTTEIVLAIAFFALYIFIRIRDSRNDEAIKHEEDLHEVYLNELKATTGNYAGFDDGQRYVDARHAYTFDLDIFGRDSLYQRLCRTATTGGSDALATRLSSLDGRQQPHTYNETYRRHIEQLARNEAFRSEVIS